MASSANKVVVDVELRAQLDSMKSGVKELEGLFKNLNLSPSKNAGMTQLFADMKKDLGEIEKLTEGGKIKGKNFKQLETTVDNVRKHWSQLTNEVVKFNSLTDKQKSQLIPANTQKQIDAITDGIKKYGQELDNLNKKSGLSNLEKQLTTAEKKVQDLPEKLEKINKALNQVAIRDSFVQGFKNAEQYVIKLQNEIKALEKNPIGANNEQRIASLNEKINVAQNLMKEFEIKAKEASIPLEQMGYKGNVSINKLTTAFNNVQGELNEAQQKVKDLTAQIEKMNTSNASAAITKIINELSKIQGLNIDWGKITSFEQLNQILNNLVNRGFTEVTSILEQVTSEMGVTSNATNELGKKMEEAESSINKMTNSMNQLSQLAQRGLYFFGLTNTVNLFKKAVRESISAVKDLDKAMTETAVVTDFSVSDMWAQLPKYNKIATEYSSTLKDAYEVMTLYYQQGLKTNQVFAVGEQTMKMARIAGLDYSVATDRMTNALRGFNMEVNSMNSEHVADVYSKLAAMSASNVKELSVAMTKVASLANSANMSFDNTAAFLAQIIETTRESAETAGTALKTVVARFSEVKKLYSEGDLIGDVEGEEVNINKVGAALRAAGVDLNEFATGAKGLDEIFIELANKWDSLDLLTQRYIATMAAGSRQQSRFLALMSDNARLTELLNGAYNAAGVSTQQFEKTEESLESKLNKLKNAWDTFLMGLANNQLIKKGVDLLTGLINTVNKFIDGAGKIGGIFGNFGSSLAKTAATATLMIAVLSKARTVIEKLIEAAMPGLASTLGLKDGTHLANQLVTSIKNGMKKNLGKPIEIPITADTRTFTEKLQSALNKIGKKNPLEIPVINKSHINTNDNTGVKIWSKGKKNEITQTGELIGTGYSGRGTKQQLANSLNDFENNLKESSQQLENLEGASRTTGTELLKGSQLQAQQNELNLEDTTILKNKNQVLGQSALLQDENNKTIGRVTEIFDQNGNTVSTVTEKLDENGNVTELVTRSKEGEKTVVESLKMTEEGKLVLDKAEINAEGELVPLKHIEADASKDAALADEFEAKKSMAAANGNTITGKQIPGLGGQTLFNSFTSALPTIAGVIGAVAIVAGTVYTLKQFHDQLNAENIALDNLKDSVQGLQEATVRAEQALENFKTASDTYKNNQDIIKNSTKKDSNYYEAIAKSNQAIIDMSTAARAGNVDFTYSIDNNGRLYASQKDIENTRKELAKKQIRAQADSISAQAAADLAEDYKNTEIETLEKIRDNKETKDALNYLSNSTEDMVGGFIAGSAVAGVGLAVAGALLSATGVGLPLGAILATAGIGSIAGGAYGAMGASNNKNATDANVLDKIYNKYSSNQQLSDYEASLLEEAISLHSQKEATRSVKVNEQKAAISNLLGEETSEIITDIFAEAITDGVDVNPQETRLSKEMAKVAEDNKDTIGFKNGKATRNFEKGDKLLEEWASSLGYKWNGKKLEDESGKEINYKDMTNEIVAWKAQQQLNDKIVENSQGLKNIVGEKGQIRSELSDLLSKNYGEVDFDELQKQLGTLTDEEKQILEDIYGTDNFDTFINEQISDATEFQKNFMRQTIQTIASQTDDASIGYIADAIKDYSVSQQQALVNLLESTDVNFQDITVDILDEFKDINWDDPIQSFNQLNDIIKNGSEDAQKFASAYKNAHKELYSTSGLVKGLVTSQEWDKISDSIDEVVESSGKLTGKDIKEMAESSDYLRTILDETSISAEGLAIVLQGVANGSYGIDQLTDNFIKAMAAGQSLQGSLEGIQKFISEFDEGLSSEIGYDWLKSSSETISGMVERKEYSNPQLLKYLRAIYGEQIFDEDGFLTPEKIEEYSNKLANSVKNGGYNFWESLDGFSEDGFSISAKNWRVQIETAGKDFDQIVQILMTKTGMTQEAIEMFLQSYAGMDPEFNKIMKESQLKKAVNEIFKDIEDGVTISEDEIKNIADALGVSIDKIKKALEDEAKAKGKDLQIYHIDENGNFVYTDKNGKEITHRAQTTVKSGDEKEGINYEDEKKWYKEHTNLSDKEINKRIIENAEKLGVDVYMTVKDEETGQEITDFFETTSDEVTSLLEDKRTINLDTSQVDAIDTKLNEIFSKPRTVLITTKTVGNGKKLYQGSDNNWYSSYDAAKNTYDSNAQGGIIGKNNTSLVGEEGPELIQYKNGGAYLAGTNGPEMTQLSQGDIVYSNPDTQKIFKRGGLSFNRYAEGTNEIRSNGVLYRKKIDGTWVRVEEPSGLEKPINTYEVYQNAADITTGELTNNNLPISGKLTEEQTQDLIDLLDEQLEEKQKKTNTKKEEEKTGPTYDREAFANAFSDARESNGSGNQYGQEVDNSIGFHRGVDLHNGGGSIPSISSGKVVSVVTGCKVGDKKANQGWGNQVIIEDEDGNKFYYSHLNGVDVSNGQTIAPGDIIGTEGNTGNSSGSHLDFMIETPNGFVDPRVFINGADLNTLSGHGKGSVGVGSGRGGNEGASFIGKQDPENEELKNKLDNNTEATEANTKATQDLANLERERSRLQKQRDALAEGGIYTAPWQIQNIEKEKKLIKKEQEADKKILDQRKEEAANLEKANKNWDEWLEKNEDGSYSYNESYNAAEEAGAIDDDTKASLKEIVDKGNEVADQQDKVDDYTYQLNDLNDQEFDLVGGVIDQGVESINQGINGMGKVAQSAIQMVEKVAQAMVDGFKSFLGWLTIRIDDEHDINELDKALKNRKELLDWEYDKLAETNFDYIKGMNSNGQANLFENINDAAQNTLIRLQNQRRLYENSFRNLEDLGTNINSDIEASLEQLYNALYGIDGVFTKINDQVQYLEARFENAIGVNLTRLREIDPIANLTNWLGVSIEDLIGDSLEGLEIFDGSLAKKFFEKTLQELGGLEISEYRLGDVGESLLQKIASFFYELSPKFDADYQIVNKSELVDALNQKMQTIITNDTITAQFVQNYLDYLTEIESQMESEVENIRSAESEILNIYDEMTEILEKGKDEYADLEQQIYDAIVSEKESLKEELETLNDNITDADSSLIEILKTNLDQMRQQRENDKTETDLRDKEARLAYLKQDSSGANRQEILKLEKELEEGQQSYTDKLIDQKISELEKQNQEAADQRQIQIDLLQEEINNTKLIWEKVKQLMDAISGNVGWDDLLTGEIDRQAYENIIEQLKKGSDFKDSSLFEQDQSINDWGVLIRKASVYGTMLKDEYQKAYNDLKIIRNVLDEDTKLASDHAADGGWHDYIAFTNLETAVKDNTSAVQNAVQVINRIVDAKTLSFDEQGSIFKKATESGAAIQAMSGLEDAIKKFAEDLASGLPGILTQVTTGVGNLAKGMLKGAGAAMDTADGAAGFNTRLGDFGEAAGMLVEGVSNLFAASCDAAALMCDIIGDTAPGFTDMGVAAGTLIANWLANAYEEVDEHLQKNVNLILDELFGDEIHGQRIGGSYSLMADTINNEKEALINYYRDNGRTLEDSREFVRKLFDGIDKEYADINEQISKLAMNDIEGYNKQYARFLALEKVLESIGHTDSVEKWRSDSIQNIEKWAGEVGSIFAEMSEREIATVVDAINQAIYPIIVDEGNESIWEDNLKLKASHIKYYNDVYKEFVDNMKYSVDAIDEAVSALNGIYYDSFENEYTSPSAQLLIQALQALEPKRAEQYVKNEKSIWDLALESASEVWGQVGHAIMGVFEKGTQVTSSIFEFLKNTFGNGTNFANAITNLIGGHATGGAIRRAERALVGELGPELVQHANGTVTLVGRGGPEMMNLKAGDEIYTAEQTKRILKAGGQLDFNRFAEGTVGTLMARPSFGFAIDSLDVGSATRALKEEGARENNFNLSLNLEGLTVDSPDRVEEVANKVWDKLNDVVSGAMWPYNKL